MKISDIVSRQLLTIPSNASVLEASRHMVQNNVGLLVVCDVNNKTKLVGVLSERDVLKAIASGNRLPDQVAAISTKQVVTVKGSAEVAEAAKAMNKHRIRHVVVVDDQDNPVGVVSMRDLVGERATLKAILQSHEKEIFVGGD